MSQVSPVTRCPSKATLGRIAGALLACAALATPAVAGAAPVSAGPRPVFGPTAPMTVTQPAASQLQLSTVPVARVASSVGINLHPWNHVAPYADWTPLMQAIAALRIHAARVDVHLVGSDFGTQREIALGQAGVKLDVILGDAFDRFSAGPFASVFSVFKNNLLPYTEAVEGSNEPDLSGNADWATTTLAHQQQIVDAVGSLPGGDGLAIFGPSTGRPGNQAALGSLAGLADFANAHAYPSGLNADVGFNNFVTPAAKLLPSGATVVTETGVQTAPTLQTPQPGVPEAVAARYVPKTYLEAIRRGIPRTYLYELVDKAADPDLQDGENHWGLLRADDTPKPAFYSLARMMAELGSGGNPLATTAPVRLSLTTPMPSDLRVVPMRRSDGTLELAIWRERQLWDPTTRQAMPVTPVRVWIRRSEHYLVARVLQLATNRTSYQFPGSSPLSLSVGDDVTMVHLMGRLP